MKLPDNFLNAEQANAISLKSEGYLTRIMNRIMNDVQAAAEKGLTEIPFYNYDSSYSSNAFNKCLEELSATGYKVNKSNRSISW